MHSAESYVKPEQETQCTLTYGQEISHSSALGLRCSIFKIREFDEMVWKVPSSHHILLFQRVILLIQSDPLPWQGPLC